MSSLNNNRKRRLNIKEPPIGINNIYSRFTSFDIMTACNALFVCPAALDDTTTSSANSVNFHIREPQTLFNYISSSYDL